MKKYFKILLLLYILLSFLNVKGQEYVGYYVTPRLSNGFFMTKIAIYSDTTFYYEFSGDLISEERNGKYSIERKQLIFDLKPDFDTTFVYYKYCDLNDIDTTNLPPLDPIIYDINENITKRYLIKKNKLIPYSKEGKLINKAKLIRIDENDWNRRHGIGIYKN